MTPAGDALVQVRTAGGVARITLNRAGRHNSLVPELLDALLGAVETVAAQPAVRAIVLAAAGRSFSTGGDLAAFHRQDAGIDAYAHRLVGLLNQAILRLLGLEVPLIGRVHGPVTGGALGLVLCCDLVAVTPRTFFAPYYVDVGLSPDGGWTALLPDRIGAHRAREIQLLNRRVSAEEAVTLGLADRLVAEEALDSQIDAWLAELKGKDPVSIRNTKRRLLTAAQRDAYARGLEAERQLFVERIAHPEARQGIERFVRRQAAR